MSGDVNTSCHLRSIKHGWDELPAGAAWFFSF